MSEQVKSNYLYQIAFSIILCVLFFIRIVFDENALSSVYIGLVNYIGAVSAFLLTGRKLMLAFPISWHGRMAMIWFFLFVIALMYGTISLAQGIVYTAKASDCITILALFFSIPCDAYYELIKRCFK